MTIKQDAKAAIRTGFEGLVSAAAGDARKLAALAGTAAKVGLPDRGYALAMEARALASDDAEIAARTGPVILRTVPDYHFGMLRDARRNAAFEAAIVRAVKPGMRVIDIGAGSGLLSMMAARVGAAEVVACEMVPAVADTARAIVAANGYADRVRIVTGRSTELDIAADLGGRADLIVSEILSHNLLGEGVLETLSDATRRMLAPGGRIIPAAGDIMIALATWPTPGLRRVGDVAGFDLSHFDHLSRNPIPVAVDHQALRLCSDAATLFSFDFTSTATRPAGRAAIPLIARGGPVDGVVQWIRLRLDDAGDYENRPQNGGASHWSAVFHPLPHPRPLDAGAVVTVRGVHDGIDVTIWTEQRVTGPV